MSFAKENLSKHWLRLLIVVGLVVVIFYFGPLIFVLNISLQSQQQFLTHSMSLPHPMKWGNFIQAWQKASMSEYFMNSIVYTLVPTVLALIFSAFLAFPISRKYIRWSKQLHALLTSGLFFPVALIPLFIEARWLHLYNNRPGYMILHIEDAMVFGFFLFVGYFRTIPKELDESAVIDGCNYIRYIMTVIAPLAKPAFATMGIYASIQIWNDLIGPVVFLASPNLFPLSRGLFAFYSSYASEWTLLAAGVLIAAAPLIVAFLFLQRYFIEGATAGSLKG
ncbi:carbohydrate ABC transporter permease [Alicyclobacillus sp. SO9]|uniref:carbohydrate ABC transporter permease n=1 Tax=Alicyclobacillus sp. SO9 TaxID=2665646 RepID=UPI0018E8A77E|nr:carbohydrate ABC transporter permease [Alicyclobacillus sp. SO9]QQE79247.1 carbohydrate ABC transporter permease [Alicyclobacillus sp. SO9]